MQELGTPSHHEEVQKASCCQKLPENSGKGQNTRKCNKQNGKKFLTQREELNQPASPEGNPAGSTPKACQGADLQVMEAHHVEEAETSGVSAIHESLNSVPSYLLSMLQK